MLQSSITYNRSSDLVQNEGIQLRPYQQKSIKAIESAEAKGIHPEITKGEASTLLSQFFAGRAH